MKYLVLIILAAGAYYWYSNSQNVEIVVKSYPDLLKKAEAQSVNLNEVKEGAYLLAEFFCNDEEFQKSGRSSVQACMSRLNKWKDPCISRVFDEAPEIFTDKAEVVSYAKRYAACTGIAS